VSSEDGLSVGDLVCFRNNPDRVGLLMFKIPVSMTHFWSVLWCNGKRTEEFEIELKKIEKKS